MSTLPEIIDNWIRDLNGGVDPGDEKYDEDYAEQKIKEGREMVLEYTYNGSRNLGRNTNIDPMFYQSVSVPYQLELQDAGACFVRFYFPDMVRINGITDGYSFVGDNKTKKGFSKLKSPEDAHLLVDTGLDKLGDIYYLAIGRTVEVYGDPGIRTIDTTGIFRNPLDCPTFDPETSQYPLPDGLIPLMFQLMKQAGMNYVNATPVDNKVDESQKSAGQ